MVTPLHIAIDGPVAAGKGDIASRLAKKLGIVYIYTGAMYRALALSCIRLGISPKDPKRVVEVLATHHITLKPTVGDDSSACRVFLGSEDVTDRITAPDTAMGASDVAVIPEVRKQMVLLQKSLAQKQSVVMEGRDIGSVVLPNAQLKIYLTASVEERAKRRHLQWQEKGIKKTFAEVLADTKTRDLQDSQRKTDPLKKLPDAWELDTTGMSQETVIERIIEKLHVLHLI